MIRHYKGRKYETLSGGDGIRLETYMELKDVESGRTIAAVSRPDVPEPTFQTFIEDQAPQELVDSFVEDAKKSLQRQYEEWAASVPELARDDAERRRALDAMVQSPELKSSWWRRLLRGG